MFFSRAVRSFSNFYPLYIGDSGAHEETMREHMRADESVHVAKRQQEELARSALSSVELVAKGSFGYM